MSIGVKKQLRRRGVGSLLMEKAEECCKERGYPWITLLVTSKNEKAVRLYKKNGFEILNMGMRKNI